MRWTTRNDLGLRPKRPMLLLLSALFVAACSDGGGDGAGLINPGPDGGDRGGDPTNRDPNASISADRTSVPARDNHNTVVILDGSGSSDPDDDQLSYRWTVPSGRFVSGTSASDARIQVTFPGARPYTITLVVDDGRGGSARKSIVIGLS